MNTDDIIFWLLMLYLVSMLIYIVDLSCKVGDLRNRLDDLEGNDAMAQNDDGDKSPSQRK